MGMLRTLQAGGALLAVGSKVPQIYTIWQQGGTGQLSAFAVFNYLFGSLARVYTTVQEVDDSLILYGFLAGLALNAILAAQMVCTGFREFLLMIGLTFCVTGLLLELLHLRPSCRRGRQDRKENRHGSCRLHHGSNSKA